jgi:hypothetical protein
MKILSTYLTMAFLTASLFISGLAVRFVSAQEAVVSQDVARLPPDLLKNQYPRFYNFEPIT